MVIINITIYSCITCWSGRQQIHFLIGLRFSPRTFFLRLAKEEALRGLYGSGHSRDTRSMIRQIIHGLNTTTNKSDAGMYLDPHWFLVLEGLVRSWCGKHPICSDHERYGKYLIVWVNVHGGYSEGVMLWWTVMLAVWLTRIWVIAQEGYSEGVIL